MLLFICKIFYYFYCFEKNKNIENQFQYKDKNSTGSKSILKIILLFLFYKK